jgi:hypothetical protein
MWLDYFVCRWEEKLFGAIIFGFIDQLQFGLFAASPRSTSFRCGLSASIRQPLSGGINTNLCFDALWFLNLIAKLLNNDGHGL